MKATFAFLFLLFSSLQGFAQFELPGRKVNIAPISDAKGQLSTTSSKAITYPSIFDKKDKLLSTVSLLKKMPKDEEKSVFDKEKFANPAREYDKTVEKLNNNFKSDFISINYGSYKSKTKSIKILCRDYDAVDGDVVRILLDDNQVFWCSLAGSNQIFYLDLPENINIIDFEAVTEGDSPPNTAEFTILDANDVLIYNGQWSLFKGFRARIKITK